MKNLQINLKPLIFFLSIGFALNSCSSDDDASSNNQATFNSDALIGKWFFESIEERDPLNDCEKTSYIEFLDNGTSVSIIYNESPNGGCGPLLGGEFTFELISESTIKFTNVTDGDTFNSEIISVSETQLVILEFAFFTAEATLIKE